MSGHWWLVLEEPSKGWSTVSGSSVRREGCGLGMERGCCSGCVRRQVTPT
jgi:hypothetical protein